MTPKNMGILGQEDELSTKGEGKDSGSSLENAEEESRNGLHSVDDVLPMGEAMPRGIEEALKRRDAILSARILQDLTPRLDESVMSTLEERLTASIGESLNERLGELEKHTADKVIASMLPGSLFARNLAPLVVGILADRHTPHFWAHMDTWLEGVVEEKFKHLIRTRLVPGSSFERNLVPSVLKFVDERLSEKLGGLLDAFEALRDSKTETRTGDTMKSARMDRISATIESETHEQMKALGGNFSEHVRNACKLYLSAPVRQKE